MKFKLKLIEKKWILYDIGNSAFAFDLYDHTDFLIIWRVMNFRSDYLAYGICKLSVNRNRSCVGAALGTVSDVAGRKKNLHRARGAFGCVFLGFMH
ncbi:MAG: hypothetical protein ACLTNW_17515 [Mediterraneibacter gnavus]